MQEVKAVRDVYFFVFGFDPGKLVYDLVTPLIHALVSDVHLGVEYP